MGHNILIEYPYVASSRVHFLIVLLRVGTSASSVLITIWGRGKSLYIENFNHSNNYSEHIIIIYASAPNCVAPNIKLPKFNLNLYIRKKNQCLHSSTTAYVYPPSIGFLHVTPKFTLYYTLTMFTLIDIKSFAKSASWDTDISSGWVFSAKFLYRPR